jgi:hypothetical protein
MGKNGGVRMRTHKVFFAVGLSALLCVGCTPKDSRHDEGVRYCLALVAAGGYGAAEGRAGAMDRCVKFNPKINNNYEVWKVYVRKLEAYCKKIDQAANDDELGRCEADRHRSDTSVGIFPENAANDPNYH